MTNGAEDRALWRSLLFVPATAERFVAKAHSRGADAIIVDLEDSVAPKEKPRARSLLPDVVKTVGQAGTDVLVRINRPWRMAISDLEAAVLPGVSAIVLTKTESAEHVAFADEVISELEADRSLQPGAIGFVTLIETAKGYLNVREIVHASPRVRAVSLGMEDFSDVIGMPEVDTEAILGFNREVHIAAREAGILMLGYPGSIADFSDLELFRNNIRRARRLGFDGGPCIHPAQVAILNEEFAPTESEVERAKRIAELYDEAKTNGAGAVAFEGKMIDEPVYRRAERTVALWRRVKDK
ncbi:MAG: HpcH/HpaI aldolase/citrate lyase family protein [Hyphomicrobiaceae bacterium]